MCGRKGVLGRLGGRLVGVDGGGEQVSKYGGGIGGDESTTVVVVVLWLLSAASKAATWNRRGQAAPAGLALACEKHTSLASRTRSRLRARGASGRQKQAGRSSRRVGNAGRWHQGRADGMAGCGSEWLRSGMRMGMGEK